MKRSPRHALMGLRSAFGLLAMSSTGAAQPGDWVHPLDDALPASRVLMLRAPQALIAGEDRPADGEREERASSGLFGLDWKERLPIWGDGLDGRGRFDDSVERGFSRNYWVLGMALEKFTSAASDLTSQDGVLLGITAMWRLGAFGPHILLMNKPSVDRFSNSRFLGGLGLRGFWDVGFTEFSYGFGAHAEVRLADHYWLMYATPVELGATLWQGGSWNIELFLGLRRAFAGHLINVFLIDPNGYDNQAAQAELDDLVLGRWRGFARVVFGRRID